MRAANLMDEIHSSMIFSPEIFGRNIEVEPEGIRVGGRTQAAFSGRHFLGEMLKAGRSDDPEAVVTRVQERLRETYAAAQEHGLLPEDSTIHRGVLSVFAEKVLEEFGFTPAQVSYAFDLLLTI